MNIFCDYSIFQQGIWRKLGADIQASAEEFRKDNGRIFSDLLHLAN